LIRRIRRSNPVTPHRPEWPEWPLAGQQLTSALFEERPSLRKLVVLADDDLLASPSDATLSPGVVLTGLLTHPYVTLLRYRDGGPPSDTPRREYGPPVARQSAAEGWAELEPEERAGIRGLVYTRASGVTHAGVLGSRTVFARRDISSPAYANLDPTDAADRRERDALALGVAEAAHADLLITQRPYLLAEGLRPLGVTVCTPSEALAIVGLYLRSQNAYVIWRGSEGIGSFGMNKGLYYWVGTRELLTAAWRWFTACVQESHGSGDGTLLDLGQSLLTRVQRVLEARDRFHRVFNLPQNNDAASEALTGLDSALVLLMGAVDSSARVAHLVLGLPGDARNAGWQRSRIWLPQVAAAEPQQRMRSRYCGCCATPCTLR
jgi:hypothetical protein